MTVESCKKKSHSTKSNGLIQSQYSSSEFNTHTDFFWYCWNIKREINRELGLGSAAIRGTSRNLSQDPHQLLEMYGAELGQTILCILSLHEDEKKTLWRATSPRPPAPLAVFFDVERRRSPLATAGDEWLIRRHNPDHWRVQRTRLMRCAVLSALRWSMYPLNFNNKRVLGLNWDLDMERVLATSWYVKCKWF